MRRIALAGTEMANATTGSIRLRRRKLGAVVTISVRRIRMAFATACPSKEIFAKTLDRLRHLSGERQSLATAA